MKKKTSPLVEVAPDKRKIGERCSVALGSAKPTLASHNARKGRNGLSRWWINTPSGVRSIKLQSYKGRLYLYGQMIDRSRGGAPTIALRFEATLAEIKQTYGTPFLPNTGDDLRAQRK